eukprot:Rhum_TRINITY_DN8908_c0_g1::Rhum_TRINITY_DN8908_c0_g1_i1::g.30557::m.30557
MSAGSGHTHHTSNGAAVTEEHVGAGAETHDDDRVSEATSRRSVSPPVTGTLAGDAWELSIKLQASQGCKPAKASVYRRQDGKLVFKKADGTEVVKEDEEKDEDEWTASAESAAAASAAAAAAAAAAPPTRYARSHSHSNLGSRGASSQAGERATGTTTPRMRGDAPASTGQMQGHDWACTECSYLNWSRKRRSTCHKCGAKKPPGGGGGGGGGGGASAAAAADAGVASEAPHQPLSRAGSRKARRPAAGADAAAAAEEGAGEAGAAKEAGGNPTPEKKRPPLAVAAMGVMGVAAMPRKNAKKTPAMGMAGGMGVFGGGGGGGGTKKRGMAMGMGLGGMGMGAMCNVGAMGPSGEGRGGARGDAAEKAPATPPRTPQSTPGDDPPTPGSSTATSVSSANPSFFCRQIAMINDVLSHTTVRAAAKQHPPHPMPTDIDPTQAGSYPLASKRGGQGGKKGGGKGAEGGQQQRAGHKRDS